MIDAAAIIDDYNNGRGPFADRTTDEWFLILGYLICELEHTPPDDKDSIHMAIDDVLINMEK